GTRGLFESRPVSDNRSQIWEAGFIKNQIESRMTFYETYAKLLKRCLSFDAKIRNGAERFRCDIEQFLAALDVIVDNAMQYAKTDIQISLSVQKGRLVVEVQDHGPGLPEDFHIDRGI